MTRAKFFCIKICHRRFNSAMQLRLQRYEKKLVGCIHPPILVRSENKQLIMTPYHANTALY